MKKKFIVSLLALVLVFTFTNKADAQAFKDIKTAHLSQIKN